MKTCVIIPTYNEKDNVVKLAHSIFETNLQTAVLVVDDNSPDGTASVVTASVENYPQLDLLLRSDNRGFGRSYIDGFKKILARDSYEQTVMMDADFSHDPAVIPAMAARLTEYDFVVGSRYVRGGDIKNWNWKRRLLSRFANCYAKTILGIPISDMTTGFMCIKTSVLKNIDLDTIKSDGYAFLVELKYRLIKAGYKFFEEPIIYNERREGQSKMSSKVIWESIWLPWRLRFSRKYLKNKIKKHWLAIVFAMIMGWMMVWPFLTFRAELGDRYQGIDRQVANDELFYLARIKDVMDEHPTLGNAYLWEHKMGLPQQLFLAEFLLAQRLKYLNINIQTGHLIYNFILPAISFMLGYLILYWITASRLWAIMFSVLLFFGIFLFEFTRPISPQFNFIFWLTQFLFLWILFTKGTSRKTVFLNVLNLGLLFYIYPYYWAYYLILLGILIVYFFFKNLDYCSALLKIVIGGLMLSSGYLYFTFKASQLQFYEDSLTRLQMIYTHFPSGINILKWAVPTLLLFFTLYRLKLLNYSKTSVFLTAAIFSVIVAVNQHIITGRNFEFSSHYYMVGVFVSVFALAYLWAQTREQEYKLKTFDSLWLGTLIILLSMAGIIKYAEMAFSYSREMVTAQEFAPIFSWLNENTSRDSVIMANESISQLAAVYTHNNVFFARNANLFLLPDVEVIDRFILNNIDKKFDRDFVITNVRSIYGVRYIDEYGHTVQSNKVRKLLRLPTKAEIYLPEIAIDVFLTRAEYMKNNLAKEIAKYRLDYIILENGQPAFAKNIFQKTLFSAGNFIILGR